MKNYKCIPVVSANQSFLVTFVRARLFQLFCLNRNGNVVKRIVTFCSTHDKRQQINSVYGVHSVACLFFSFVEHDNVFLGVITPNTTSLIA